jgi:hypothetical protein
MLGNLEKSINRHQWIAEAAYFIAETRQFEPGKALDDWLAAEIAYTDMLIASFMAVLAEDGPITLVGLRQLASMIGIENSSDFTSEVELIRTIQNAARHRPCFRLEATWTCDDTDCQWRAECRRLISVWCQ